MAKSKKPAAKAPTKPAEKPAAKSAAKSAAKPKAKHGPPAEEGIATAREYNESVGDANVDVAPEGVVTWPTEYGNPDMTIAPATPTVIDPATGLAAPINDIDQSAAATEGNDAEA